MHRSKIKIFPNKDYDCFETDNSDTDLDDDSFKDKYFKGEQKYFIFSFLAFLWSVAKSIKGEILNDSAVIHFEEMYLKKVKDSCNGFCLCGGTLHEYETSDEFITYIKIFCKDFKIPIYFNSLKNIKNDKFITVFTSKEDEELHLTNLNVKPISAIRFHKISRDRKKIYNFYTDNFEKGIFSNTEKIDRKYDRYFIGFYETKTELK